MWWTRPWYSRLFHAVKRMYRSTRKCSRRADRGRLDRADGDGPDEVRRGQGTRPAAGAGVEDRCWLAGACSGLVLQEHAGIVVGQMEQATSQEYGDRIGRVEVEEPDARVTVRQPDVGPHIGLVKARKPRDGRQPDRPYSGHRERD